MHSMWKSEQSSLTGESNPMLLSLNLRPLKCQSASHSRPLAQTCLLAPYNKHGMQTSVFDCVLLARDAQEQGRKVWSSFDVPVACPEPIKYFTEGLDLLSSKAVVLLHR